MPDPTKESKSTALARPETATLVEDGDRPLALDAMTAIQSILAAAKDPTTSIDKVERLTDLYQRMYEAEAKRRFREDMALCQAELPQLAKKGEYEAKGGKRRFVRLEDLDEEIRPIYTRHGFSLGVDSKPGPDKQQMTFAGELSHRAGHAVMKHLVLPIDEPVGRNAIQAVGSTVTYAKRYLLVMHFNLTPRGVDNDGNGAPAFITPLQATFLREQMDRLKLKGEDPAKEAERSGYFLNWLNAADYESISAVKFDRAKKFIEEKLRKAGVT